jgi:outer membrane receptor protein involved in Fe transport
MGADVDAIRYQQDVKRNGIEFRRADGTIARETRYGGFGGYRNSNREFAAYIQDTWRLRPSLMLELGLRHEWDSLVRAASLAPRAGIAWGLGENTKVAGGYAAVYEPGNLRTFSEPLDQFVISTAYPGPFDRLVSVTMYRVHPPALRSPLYTSWSATVEHQFPSRIYTRAAYVRRRGTRGFSYHSSVDAERPPFVEAVEPGAHLVVQELRNLRSDVYDGLELMARHTFRGRYEWMVSYTRSRALSNAVTDVRVDNPILSPQDQGPMPWDSPNRMLTWGYLPAWSKNWAIAYMCEWRTGQPFSIQDEIGNLMGRVNEHRYPDFFELNVHLERRFSALGYAWAFRFGVNNATNHKNPNTVSNVFGAPDFMRYYGGQKRAFNFRIRWLGKE